MTARIMAFKAGDSVLQQRVAELEKQAASQKAEELVGLALKDGKLSPAQKEWAVAYALSDPKGFAAFVEKAPVVVPMGKTAFAVDERKQTGVDWKIFKEPGSDRGGFKRSMEVWKMIRTGNEKLDPKTLVLPVAASAAITEATMVALGAGRLRGAGLEGSEPTVARVPWSRRITGPGRPGTSG